MKLSSAELSEIVSTRTCHDLIGCIGSLGNIVELMGEDGSADAEMKNVLSEIAFILSARQKFFRMAFGLATAAKDNDELYKICQEYLNTLSTRGGKIKLDLQNISPQLSKMICLCVMIAGDIFIHSGTIEVSVNKENIRITALSENKFNEKELSAYNAILSGQRFAENISKYAHLYYLKEWLGEKVPLKVDASGNKIIMVIG